MNHIKRLRFGIAFAAVALLVPSVSSGELDLPGLNARLDNHEARITNNEKDIKALQASTNTEASSDHVSVPVVPEATPAAETAPMASPEPTATPTPESTPAPTPFPETGPHQGDVKITN